MKLLRIISTTDPEAGGVIESVLQASVAMQVLGHEVELLCMDANDSSWLKSLPIKTHAVGPGATSFGYCPRIKRWLIEHHGNYDAFIIDGLWQYHGFTSRDALLRLGRRYHVYPHGMLDPWFKRKYPLKHIKKWLYWLVAEYRVIRDAEKVFFTTEEEKEVSQNSFWLYRCNGEVAPIGTTAFTGDIKLAKQEFFQQYPLLCDKPYLLFLSRIHPKKGLDLLLNAFAEHHKLQPGLHLVIAGPDQAGWRLKLEELAVDLGIEDKVTWTGMLKGNIKWGAYFNAEAFILPSHQENFGIVVAEALSSGTPTLISNKVNIWREVDAESAGLVEMDTVVGCGRLLKNWIGMNDDARENMIVNTKTCFDRHFEISNAAINLVKALGY